MSLSDRVEHTQREGWVGIVRTILGEARQIEPTLMRVRDAIEQAKANSAEPTDPLLRAWELKRRADGHLANVAILERRGQTEAAEGEWDVWRVFMLDAMDRLLEWNREIGGVR